MDLEVLWKAIVPLSFLAFWALIHLFNREAKPLPARVGSPRPANPYASGARPLVSSPPTPRPATPAPAPSQPAMRWAPPNQGVGQGLAGSRPLAPPRPGGDDDIVILDSPRTSPTPPIRPITPARRARPKPQAPPRPPAKAPEPKRGLAGVTQSVNQQLAATPHLSPLSNAMATSTEPRVTGSGPSASAIAPTATDLPFGLSIRDPRRLRDAIIANEILQPPLALRNRRRP